MRLREDGLTLKMNFKRYVHVSDNGGNSTVVWRKGPNHNPKVAGHYPQEPVSPSISECSAGWTRPSRQTVPCQPS